MDGGKVIHMIFSSSCMLQSSMIGLECGESKRRRSLNFTSFLWWWGLLEMLRMAKEELEEIK